MAYRNDVDALEARLAALQGDVKETTKARDEVAQLLAEARARAAAEGLAADWAAGGPQRRRRRRIWIAVALATLAVMSTLVTSRLLRHKEDSFTKVMAQFSVFSDQMCACRDKACVDKVTDEMTRWSQEMAKQDQAPPHMSEEQIKAATEIGERMGKCMQSAMSAPEIPDQMSSQDPQPQAP
jgi:hypothetical protein